MCAASFEIFARCIIFLPHPRASCTHQVYVSGNFLRYEWTVDSTWNADISESEGILETKCQSRFISLADSQNTETTSCIHIYISRIVPFESHLRFHTIVQDSYVQSTSPTCRIISKLRSVYKIGGTRKIRATPSYGPHHSLVA